MKRVRLAAVAAIFSLGVVSAFGALNAYLKIEGTTTKSFNPEVPSGVLRVKADSAGIISPRDAASGLPTGKRQHKPFVITKELDKSSPLLTKALANNEALKEMTLTFFQAMGDGSVRLTRQAKFTGVKIMSVKSSPANPSGSASPPMEEISFVFQKIEWTVINRTQGANDWKLPR
jgi:type VI secretion system secreted protein Hcp